MRVEWVFLGGGKEGRYDDEMEEWEKLDGLVMYVVWVEVVCEKCDIFGSV